MAKETQEEIFLLESQLAQLANPYLHIPVSYGGPVQNSFLSVTGNMIPMTDVRIQVGEQRDIGGDYVIHATTISNVLRDGSLSNFLFPEENIRTTWFCKTGFYFCRITHIEVDLPNDNILIRAIVKKEDYGENRSTMLNIHEMALIKEDYTKEYKVEYVGDVTLNSIADRFELMDLDD